MNKKSWVVFVVCVLMSIAAVAVMSGCEKVGYHKFSVGDCVVPNWKQERWATPLPQLKILEVGEVNSYRTTGPDLWFGMEETLYNKVACK